MNRLARWALAVLALIVTAAPASAQCTLQRVTSISGLTATLGTYSATSPPSQTLNLTIVMRKNNGVGFCTGSMAFLASVIPAEMTGPGVPVLQYQVNNTSSASLLYTGTPGTRVTFTGFSFGARSITFNVSVVVPAVAGQTGLQFGSYSDTSVLPRIFNGTVSITALPGAAPTLSVTADVAKSCTIDGVATPAADSATIPILSDGSVNTSAIPKSYTNGECTAPANLLLTSQTGAVLTGATAPSGFTNKINYSVSATFSGASASLNTASNPAASGPESGTAAGTSGAIPSGTLAVTITPQSSASPLVSGSYSDTLRITITPQ